MSDGRQNWDATEDRLAFAYAAHVITGSMSQYRAMKELAKKLPRRTEESCRGKIRRYLEISKSP